MSIGKSLLYAVGITAVSVVALTIARGMPTGEQLLTGSATMFVMAFIVMKLWGVKPK
ncbi:MAG: hypothetical protein NT026_00250 [Candidatus Staskawiczbacteria bacterium]|nr:hypothetical protein [Candidatus Staskawiczbacteria bacterium]